MATAGLVAAFSAETTPLLAADYSYWTNNLGVVTWAGTSSDFGKGKFYIFDAATGMDGTEIASANDVRTDLPGYVGTSVRLRAVFQKGGTGKYKNPGYAIRFTSGDKYKTLDYAYNNFTFGGLIVEPGATGYSFTSSTASRNTAIGDDTSTGGIETWFSIGEDFTILRGTGTAANSAFAIRGKVNFDIAEGKTFDINSSSTFTAYPTLSSGAVLKMHGLGKLRVNTLVATGSVTLDYSDLDSVKRQVPYIDGKLTLDSSSTVLIPSGLLENEPFELCSGDLTAPDTSYMGPMTVDGEKKMVVFVYDVPNRAISWHQGLCPEAENTVVPEGYSITIPCMTDPAEPYVWSGKMTVNGTLNVSGYVNFDNALTLNGKMVIDPTAFADVTAEQIALIHLASGSSVDVANIVCTDISKWDVSVSGNIVYLNRGGYSHWKNNPGVFNWQGTSLKFKEGQFQSLDVDDMSAGKVYSGLNSYEDVPGQIGKTVSPFWSIFSDGDNWVSPGYALRFVSGMGVVGSIDAQFAKLRIGGLIVEAGASGMSIGSSSTTEERSTYIGDVNGETETWMQAKNDFAIERSGKAGTEARFCGKVNLDVAADKAFSFNANSTVPVELDSASATILSMSGQGSLKVGTLVATNSVSLDFSNLASTRARAYIDGALTIDEKTIFRFPADLEENQRFKICTGNLTVGENPQRFFYLGDKVMFANLEFDTYAIPKTVLYKGVGRVNTATVSNDVLWTAIVWNDGEGWKEGYPGLITLKDDVNVTFDEPLSGSVDLVLAGNYCMSMVCNRVKPQFDSVRCGEGATYKWVIPYGSQAFTTDTSLGIAQGEEWVIIGRQNEGAEKSPMEWSGSIAITGTLSTVGHVSFVSENNRVIKGARLCVSTGSLKVNGAKNGFAGTIEIASGAKLEIRRTADLLSTSDAVSIDVHGELSMPESRLEFGAKASLNLYGGGVVSGAGDGNGAMDFNKMPTLNVIADGDESTAQISATVRYRSDVTFSIGEGAMLNLATTNVIGYESYSVLASGDGTINILSDAIVPFSASGCCKGGFIGSGTAFFKAIPADAALCNVSDRELWNGTVLFNSVSTMTAFNPNCYGNIDSVVALRGCAGGFAAGDISVIPTLEMMTNASQAASFKVTTGTAGSRVEIGALTGNGTLTLADTSTKSAYGIFLPNGMDVFPSISVEGASSKIAVIAGAGIADFSGDLSSIVGSISIPSGGSARIRTGATWSAVNGLKLANFASLVVDGGRIGSKVSGNGVVTYTGDVSNVGIEEAAEFDDETAWTGTVLFEGAYFHSTSFEHIGNRASTVKFSQTDRCQATAVVWPSELVVDADDGSVLFAFDDEPTPGFADVVVRKAGDTSTQFELKYDSDIKSVYVSSKTVPPSFTLAGTRIEYGADLASARYVLTIADYESGSHYEDVSAVLTVYDVYGAAIEQRGLFIDGDGDYYFDSVVLRDGRESGYSYSVTMTTRKGVGEIEEVLATCNSVDYAVHHDDKTDWVKEDATTFTSTVPAEKTGEWTGEGSVKDGKIQVGTDDSIGNLKFDAYEKSSQAVVNMDVVYEVHEYGDVDATEIPDDVQTLLTVVGDGYDGICFAAWSGKERKFIKLYGTGNLLRPEEGNTYRIRASFNYKMGVVSFMMDDQALTNSSGCAFIPFRNVGEGSLKGMRFRGTGTVTLVEGDQRNGDLAAIVVGGITNRYGTVEEAIASQGGGSTKVTLLWDASWKPSTNYLDKTISYDGGSEGYKLYVDSAAEKQLESDGYVVIRNEDGSYSVGIVTFNLIFNGNGGGGEMESIPFTATNAVVKLSANLFEKKACDFAHWNAAADGSGPTNYEDCATIDLSPYGASNVTLFAQWKIATRKFTIATPNPRVYIEQVETNAAVHSGVRYYRSDVPGEAASAIFDVENGSRVVVRFSTDIETNLTPYAYIDYKVVDSPTNITYALLPKLPGSTGSISLTALSSVERWAVSRGITLPSLASSNYKSASYGLDSDGLIGSSSIVEIYDFAVVAGGCSFKVKLDGQTLYNRSALASMIKVSEDLIKWGDVSADCVTIDGNEVFVKTEDLGKFIKIVIPKD